MRDFVAIGAGSSGCVVAAELARREAGSVAVIEAGPTEMHPLVCMPFGLIWLLGGKRDWALRTAPRETAGGRTIGVPRGRMVGGSGFINSMVWFRGRADDFDGWNVPGWSWSDVAPAFAAVVVLSAGSLASPAILMRSGFGPTDDLAALGIASRRDAPEIGGNLHDHPGVGLHFEGPGSGYGLEPRQWICWAAAPFVYALSRKGRFASPTVEGSAFFKARGDGGIPDVQTHFIPFHPDWKGRKYSLRAGYFADICLCLPKSRGSLRLGAKDGRIIDLGLFREESDLDKMTAGIERLRLLLDAADFGSHRAPEAHPVPRINGSAFTEHIRQNAKTADHPIGTLRMGNGDAPVTPRLAGRGADYLWVADASVMPAVTSANTNAPCMMIGWKGAEFIAEDAA